MMTEHFFNVIKNCDVIYPFVDSKLGKYSQGVLKEISYAKSNSIEVVESMIKPKMKSMTKIKTLHKKRSDFYNKSNAMNFIKDYFDVKEGIRCVIGHEKNYLMPTYRIWNNNKIKSNCRPMLGDSLDKYLKKYNCNHTFIYTYKKEIDNWYPKTDKIKMYENNVVGMNQVIDLDMPDDIEGEKCRRQNFFDRVDEFNHVIDTVGGRLNDFGEEYQLMFSGNGIYMLLQGYYEENLDDYRNNIINLIDHLKETDLGDKSKVHICNKGAPWNRYYKLPFVFHETRPRMSVPLCNGKIDGEWLDRVSNVDNVLNDYTIVDEIIEKCRWNKIW